MHLSKVALSDNALVREDTSSTFNCYLFVLLQSYLQFFGKQPSLFGAPSSNNIFFRLIVCAHGKQKHFSFKLFYLASSVLNDKDKRLFY